MNQELRDFVIRCYKIELKWMYHYEVDDDMFGVETDRYQWCSKMLDGLPVEMAIEYFEKHYPKDEVRFIERLKELAR
ncbi:MAG: hypothetical protein K0R18_399 [Bacillales bacterium]|jgi:hypothetical protein|nr:hypothetical protein [Bacillales bacterium]